VFCIYADFNCPVYVFSIFILGQLSQVMICVLFCVSSLVRPRWSESQVQ
jgi:hypothetical protein